MAEMLQQVVDAHAAAQYLDGEQVAQIMEREALGSLPFDINLAPEMCVVACRFREG